MLDQLLRASMYNETGIRSFNLTNFKLNVDADYYMLTEYNEETWLQSILTKHIITNEFKSYNPTSTPIFPFKP